MLLLTCIEISFLSSCPELRGGLGLICQIYHPGFLLHGGDALNLCEALSTGDFRLKCVSRTLLFSLLESD